MTKILEIIIIFLAIRRVVSFVEITTEINFYDDNSGYIFVVKAINLNNFELSTKIKLNYIYDLKNYLIPIKLDNIIKEIFVIDLKSNKNIRKICELALLNVPIIILTKNEHFLSEENVTKYIKNFKEIEDFLFLGLMNEQQSEIFRNIPKEDLFFSTISNRTILKIDLTSYLMLAVIFLILYLVIYVCVRVLSEKEPVCVPRLLDKYNLIEYRNISNKEYSTRCIICLDDFNEKDICRLLGCRHFFHSICVDPWLKKKSSKCPLCSRYLNPNFYS